MNKIVLTSLLVLLLLGTGFFLYLHTNKSNPVSKPTTVSVGWIGPLTGDVKVLGVDNLKAVQLAFKEYNTKRNSDEPEINLIYADDQYNASKSVTEFKKMMMRTDNLVAVFISTYSAMKPLNGLAKNKVLLINPIDNDVNLAKLNTYSQANLFFIAKETEGLASIIADALIKQDKKNTVVLYYGDDDFMPTLALSLNQILQSKGREVKLFKYGKNQKNFSEFLNWGKEHNADAYVFFGYPELGLAMKQARDLGITASFYSVNVITDPLFQTNSQGAVNGTMFAHFTYLDGNKIKANEFKKAYYNAYQAYPTVEWTAMQAYDASNILIQAIKEAWMMEGDFTENLHDIMRQVADFQGVSGTLSIKPNGASQGIYPSLYIMQDGKANPYK